MLEGKIDKQYIYKVEIKTTTDVKEYRAMGMWYMDRNAGELKYRLLGLAPVVTDLATKPNLSKLYRYSGFSFQMHVKLSI